MRRPRSSPPQGTWRPTCRWISFTAIDRSGRNLSGQTVEAFWTSIEHAHPLIVGVNCSLGATEMRPFVEDLARVATTYVACHPNAGLPNAMGEHDEQPGDTSRILGEFVHEGLVNVVGGCCGTTPDTSRPLRPWPRDSHQDASRRDSGARASAASSRSRSGRTPVS